MADSSKQTNLLIDESLLCDLQDLQSLDPNYSSTTTASLNQSLPPNRGNEKDNVGLPRGTGMPGSSRDVQEAQSSSILDFSGLKCAQRSSSVWGMEGKLSLRCKLNVNSLTVTFNKQEHPLARGSVSGVSAEVRLAQGNMEISGALGQGSVVDMTETGAYYRER